MQPRARLRPHRARTRDLLWEPEQPVLDEQVVEDDGPLLWDDDGSAGRSAALTGGSNYVTDPSMP